MQRDRPNRQASSTRRQSQRNPHTNEQTRTIAPRSRIECQQWWGTRPRNHTAGFSALGRSRRGAEVSGNNGGGHDHKIALRREENFLQYEDRKKSPHPLFRFLTLNCVGGWRNNFVTPNANNIVILKRDQKLLRGNPHKCQCNITSRRNKY